MVRAEGITSAGDSPGAATIVELYVMSAQRFGVSVNITVFGIYSGHGTSSSAGGSRGLSFGEDRPPAPNAYSIGFGSSDCMY